jgi:hypothetical protein
MTTSGPAGTKCQHTKPLTYIVCGWGFCVDCDSTMRTINGRTPELNGDGEVQYAENGDNT